MAQIKTTTIDSALQQFILFGSFISLAAFTPYVIHEQWITGPLINAILIATTLTIGPWEAIFIAFIPSSIAVISGTLPVFLVPVIPAIILGNILLIAGIQLFKSKPIIGVLTGAITKFIWLTIASTWIMQFFIADNFLGKVSTILSWPQLATALLGGVIALGILKIMKK